MPLPSLPSKGGKMPAAMLHTLGRTTKASTKNSLLSSPPKITPVVVTALQTLLATKGAAPELGTLLLLEQDLKDYITVPPSMKSLWNSNPAVEEVNQRFLGKGPSFGEGNYEREFSDAGWCQRYLDALFDIDSDYPLAASAFIRSMHHYRTAGDDSTLLKGIPRWDQVHQLRTVNELAVMKVAATLMEKPQWETKVDNAEIVEKWKLEAAEQGQRLNPFAVDFGIKRARWLRKTRDALTGSMLTHISGVYVSDLLMDRNDLSALRDIAATLEDVPDRLKDWHPGSDGQVLDLLHPSLHPYVRGRTPRYVAEMSFELADNASLIERLSVGIIKGCGTPPSRHSYASPEAALSSFGEGVPTTSDSARKDTIELSWPRESGTTGNSVTYQWLPTDVSLSIPTSEPATFPKVQFLSYINNLHPRSSTIRKEKMYPILERIFAKFIPMFGRAISRWEDRPSPAYPEPYYCEGEDDGDEDEDVEEEERKDVDTIGRNMADKSGDPLWDLFAGIHSYTSEHDWTVPPSVIDETEHEPNPQSYEFKESEQLQVIIKLANIHLTPEKPDYPGGSWHVEGTDTERICATGIYYYDSENITTSKLSFRVANDEPDDFYNQYRYECLERKYGIEQDGPMNQFLGSVVTQQGRCICFPNNMQHRVEPFSLSDRTKPGHRKILAFFLINPLKRVLSTSDVPPQQFEWFASEIRKSDNMLSRLPQEVFDSIMEQASVVARKEGYPWPMSWEEALRHRELLMAERGRFTVRANENTYEQEFSFCEH